MFAARAEGVVKIWEAMGPPVVDRVESWRWSGGETLSVARRLLDQLDDGLPGGFRQRWPGGHECREISVRGEGIGRNCTGLCSACRRVLRFLRGIGQFFESLPDYYVPCFSMPCALLQRPALRMRCARREDAFTVGAS